MKPVDYTISAGDDIGKVFQGIQGPEKASPLVDAYTKQLMQQALQRAHEILNNGGSPQQAHDAVKGILEEAKAAGGGAAGGPAQPQGSGTPAFGSWQQWDAGPQAPAPMAPTPEMAGGFNSPNAPAPSQAMFQGLGGTPVRQQPGQGLGASPQGPAARVAPSAFAAPPPMASTAPPPSPMMPGQQPAPQMGLGAPPPQAQASTAPPPASLPPRAPMTGAPPSRGALVGQAQSDAQQTLTSGFRAQGPAPMSEMQLAAMQRMLPRQGQGQPIPEIPAELWKQPLLQRDVELLTPKLMTGTNYGVQNDGRLASLLEKSREADMRHQERTAALEMADANRSTGLTKLLLSLDQKWKVAQMMMEAKRRGQNIAGSIAVLNDLYRSYDTAMRARSQMAAAGIMMGEDAASQDLLAEITAGLPQMKQMLQEQGGLVEDLAGGGAAAPSNKYEYPGTATVTPVSTAGAGPHGSVEGPPQQKVGPKLVPRKKPVANPDRPPSPFGTEVVIKKASASGSTLTPTQQQALDALTK